MARPNGKVKNSDLVYGFCEVLMHVAYKQHMSKSDEDCLVMMADELIKRELLTLEQAENLIN